MARIKTSARDANEPIDQHAIGLLEAALEASHARARGGHQAAAQMSPDARSARARTAATARWKKG
jgi:hypothetical protein